MAFPIQLASVYADEDKPTAEYLTRLGFLLWIVAYLLIIRRAALDRAPGMPTVAVFTNLTWEFLLGVFCPIAAKRSKAPGFCGDVDQRTDFETWALLIWLALDIVIFVQICLWGGPFTRPPLDRYLGAYLLGGLLLAGFGQAFFMRNPADLGGVRTAWLGNLLMSILFLSLALEHPDHRGLSHGGAWFKLFGSAAFAAGMIVGRASEGANGRPDARRDFVVQVTTLHPIHYFLFASVLLFDVAYILALR